MQVVTLKSKYSMRKHHSKTFTKSAVESLLSHQLIISKFQLLFEFTGFLNTCRVYAMKSTEHVVKKCLLWVNWLSNQAAGFAGVSWEISLSPCITCRFTQSSSLTARSRHRVFNCSVKTTPHPFSLYQCIDSQGNSWLSPQCCAHSLSCFPLCISFSYSVPTLETTQVLCSTRK